MLYNLLNQINNIIPVQMLSEVDGIIEVSYDENHIPSELQSQQINTLIEQWPIYKLKLEKIELLDNAWKDKIKTGWETPAGYSLGIDISDVALLNGAFTLAKEANNMGMTDPVTIVDINGQSYSMSLQDLTILMLQYGQARSLLSNSYASIKQSINSASTLEELEAINITI